MHYQAQCFLLFHLTVLDSPLPFCKVSRWTAKPRKMPYAERETRDRTTPLCKISRTGSMLIGLVPVQGLVATRKNSVTLLSPSLDSMINGRKWSNRLFRGLGVDWREWSKDSNTFIASIIFCCMITTMYIYNKAHCGVLTVKKCNKK
jgi:hypothetical protein